MNNVNPSVEMVTPLGAVSSVETSSSLPEKTTPSGMESSVAPAFPTAI